MDEKKISTKVICPTGIFYDKNASSVVFQAHDGERAVLYNHAPFVCTLGVGILRIEEEPGRYVQFYVENGVMDVKNNNLSVLTEKILTPKDIQKEKLQEEIGKIQERPINTSYSMEDRKKDMRKASMKLKLFEKTKV